MNTRKEWRSKWPYDATAQRIIIDGKHVAFLRYSDEGLQPDSRAEASGNVITLRPILQNARNLYGDQPEAILEHEKQHVVQFLEVSNFDHKYAANNLIYEKEACARTLLKLPATQEIRFSIVNHLAKIGMVPDEAYEWIEQVLTTRTYPGVTTPRLEGN